jgi:hypothetical protein
MSRRILLTATFAALLLTAIPAIQSPALASEGGRPDLPSPFRLAALTHSYFVALDYGQATGNFSALGAMIAPAATLTERSMLVHSDAFAETRTLRGRSAIISFYRHLAADFPGGRWIVGIRNQVSPTTVVVYARGIDAQGRPSLYSVQRVTVRNGKITRLNLVLDYLQ